ncbi:hypothetical protein GCM10017600_68490 [Streptosporangium carneum]|uniref:Uncharacterized protein n=1 Tax=Streptosporangium carneum TaxID=47481 RepID=A0A9W6MGY8_9ACTN|nr:hypothetical protein GCM10017600_68490 [Streptosporangium carneum]
MITARFRAESGRLAKPNPVGSLNGVPAVREAISDCFHLPGTCRTGVVDDAVIDPLRNRLRRAEPLHQRPAQIEKGLRETLRPFSIC